MAKPKDTPPMPDVSSATESTLYSPEFQTPSPASNIDEPTKYHDAPEVVPGSSLPDFSYNSSRHDTAKQVAYGEDPEVDHSARDDTSKHIIIGGGDLEVAVGKGLEVVVESEEQKTNAEGPEKTILPIAWWKQKRIWIPAAVAFVLIIGLAVGLGVGLSQSRNGNTGSSNSQVNTTGTDNNTTDNNAATVGPVSCEKADGGVCPQILSHASLGGRSHLFARGNEGGIRYLLVDDMESWSGSGLFLNTQDFGIASQPMTKGWTFDENNDRIDLVVVGTNNKVYWVAKEYNTWGDGLVEIGGNVDSSPVISLVAADQLEVWVLDSRTELLSSKSINTTDGTFSTSEDWIESDIGPMTGNPAIIGRQWGLNESTPETGTHDYVFYNTKGNQTVMVHHRDKGSAKFEGGFVGDPTIYRFESNIDKVQIFGVQINESLKDMVHLTYNADDNTHSNIVNLGGDVTSVPSVISLVEGTMDLVALDSYGKVQHLHYDGANWSEWEDLGMEAQSAPLMINFNDKVSIFAVQESGDLVYARMDVSAAQDSHHWADQLTHMTTPDSNLSLDFYRVRHED